MDRHNSKKNKRRECRKDSSDNDSSHMDSLASSSSSSNKRGRRGKQSDQHTSTSNQLLNSEIENPRSNKGSSKGGKNQSRNRRNRSKKSFNSERSDHSTEQSEDILLKFLSKLHRLSLNLTVDKRTNFLNYNLVSLTSLHIPGFYYDPDKKRYFKIMDNANITSAVTRETIAKEKSEKKRLEALQTLSTTQKCESLSDLTNLLFNSRQGDISHLNFRRTMLLNHARNLRLIKSQPFFENPVHGHEKVEHMIKMISSPSHDKLLCLWSMKETIMQRLQLVQLSRKKRDSENQRLSLNVQPRGTTVLQSWSKITNVCWAPFPNYPERRNILYTTNCHSTGQALAFIRNLDATSPRDVAFFDFSIGNQATWTCAWNYNTEKFSVGAEKTCLLIDVETRRLWELNTLNSDPLAQTFSSCHLLYSGTKKGQIVTHDLRSKSVRPIKCISHKSSISHLLLSTDDKYLYASDYSGKIKVWDMRKNSVVMQYDGLHNEYKRIPFYIDESNTLLYGAGQDGYSRIWCLKTGQLLLNLPPPCSTSWDTIPSLQFSGCWAKEQGNSGLLMGLGDKLYLYSS
ncbi:hypothetical protein LOTGIDRAFT_232438 [Lottia gigantea]|uniref:Uncharacterized protein n=1 Tax=Lottia gigantea TaxID=225164 RepID=V4AKS4_LOTGI|nr:hypothetical protein LOTGIDRAFT_232438 [Lottia gigantea]ESO94176.1 hypothetical protein LOTGIDRAFT_232438 [Lottia gigantea]